MPIAGLRQMLEASGSSTNKCRRRLLEKLNLLELLISRANSFPLWFNRAVSRRSLRVANSRARLPERIS
jgi:hypothetical protein